MAVRLTIEGKHYWRGGGEALDKRQSPLYGPTGKAVGEDLVK
jgi:hypothetical protein